MRVVLRRPAKAPALWRECGLKATFMAGKEYNAMLPAQWTLVLNARNIPHKIVRQNGRSFLFVPALYSRLACCEMMEYLQEPPLKPKSSFTSTTVSLQPIFFILAALALFHALRMGWWGGLGLSPEEWLVKGALSAQKVYIDGEWYRAITALTLHADSAHLIGNIIFGGIVLTVLGLRCGAFSALWLSFWAGVSGNLLAAYLRLGTDYNSVGASTALFGAMGALCGLSIALRDLSGWRRVFFPLAAGFAWLAFLGTEGVRVDISAHLAGLITGICFGLLAAFLQKHNLVSAKTNLYFGLASFLLIILAWGKALAMALAMALGQALGQALGG